MKKRLLTVLLTLSIVLTYMPAMSFADDEIAHEPSGNETVELNDSGYEAEDGENQETQAAPAEELSPEAFADEEADSEIEETLQAEDVENNEERALTSQEAEEASNGESSEDNGQTVHSKDP